LGATGAQAAITVSSNGIGDMLLVPYYTAQAENATLLSITNTDTVNGKAVKVRFRGAANSDDVFDFQVFLSPADVWTANISKGADGKAVLTTTDASCTKPAKSVLNATPFITSRLDPSLTGDALANGTREGYVEIITMADIPKTGTSNIVAPVTVNPLYTAIKHVSSVAPCSGTAWTGLDELAQTGTTWSAKGMAAPTGGLMANWSIVNTVNSAAWSGQATALITGASNNVLYFSQTSTPVTDPELHTADPLFLKGSLVHSYSATTQALANTGAATVAAIATPGLYDLPDLSTPATGGGTAAAPTAQVKEIQTALAKSSVIAEFATESGISGSTDWVFSMPTRRYAVAMAYSKISSTDDGRRFNAEYQGTTAGAGAVAGTSATAVFNGANTSVINRLICVSGEKPVAYDREENTATSGVVVSPAVLGKQQYCGEVSVFAFNNGAASAALKASVAVSAVDVTYSTGWATLNTTVKAANGTSSVGLPLLGGAFMKAANGAQGYGITQAYRY